MKILKNEIINNITNNNLFKNTGKLQLNYKFFNIFNFKTNIFNADLNININIIKNNNNKNSNRNNESKNNKNIKK